MSLPNGSFMMVPDGVSYEQAMSKARSTYPDAFNVPPPEMTAGRAFTKGLKNLGSQGRELYDILSTGNINRAALNAAEREKALEQEYGAGSDLSRVSEAYKEKGVGSAVKELGHQSLLALAENAPNLIGMGIGSLAAGPAGLAAAAYLPRVAGNLSAQAAQQQAAGKAIDVSGARAMGYAAPMAAVDVAANLVPFGKVAIGKVFGPTVERLLANGATKEAEIAARGVLKSAGVGILKNAAEQGVLQPTQVMLGRLQTGQDLFSNDALAEYGNALYTAGLMSPLGAVGGVSERGAARGAVAERENAERALASVGPPKPSDQQMFDRDFVGPPKPPEFVGPPKPAPSPASFVGPRKPTPRQAFDRDFVGPAKPTVIDMLHEAAQAAEAKEQQELAAREQAEGGEDFVGPPTPPPAYEAAQIGPPKPTQEQMAGATQATANRLLDENVAKNYRTPDLQTGEVGGFPQQTPVSFTPERAAEPVAPPAPSAPPELVGPPTPSKGRIAQAIRRTAAREAKEFVGPPKPTEGISGEESRQTDERGTATGTDVSAQQREAGTAESTQTAPSGVGGIEQDVRVALTREGRREPPLVGPPKPSDQQMFDRDFVGPPKPQKREYNATERLAIEQEKAEREENERQKKIREDIIRQVANDTDAADLHYRRGYLQFFDPRDIATTISSYSLEARRAYEKGQHTARNRYLRAKLADKLMHDRDVGNLEEQIKHSDERIAEASKPVPNFAEKADIDKLHQEIYPEPKEETATGEKPKRDVVAENYNDIIAAIRALDKVLPPEEIADHGAALIKAMETAQTDRKTAIRELLDIKRKLLFAYGEQQEERGGRSKRSRKTKESEEGLSELTGEVSLRARPDRYSVGKTGQTSVDEITGELKKAYGIHAKRLLDSGRVKIVRSVDDLPPGNHFPETRGVVVGNTAYIVAENINAHEARSVLLHEVGSHMGMENMLKPEHFKLILDNFAERVKQGEKAFVDAMNLAEKEVPKDHPDREETVKHEALAYLIESRKDLGFVKRILSEIKVALNDFFDGKLFNLNEDDLRTAAIAGLRRVAKASDKPVDEAAEVVGRESVDTMNGEIPEGTSNASARYSTASADELAAIGNEDLHYAEPTKGYLGKAFGFLSNMKPSLRDAYHNMLSLNQLDQLYGEQLKPLSALNRLMNQRGASLLKRKEALNDNISRWYKEIRDAKISDADLDKFNDLATRSTVFQVEYLDRPEIRDAAGNVTQRKRVAKTDHLLYQQFDELTRKHPILKQIYEELRNDYDKHSDELLERLTAPLSMTAAQKLRVKYEESRIPIYLPLYRRGDHWLSYTDSTGETVKSAFPSVAERDKAAAKAKAEGATDIQQYRKIRDMRKNSTPPTGFLGDVVEALAKEGVTDDSVLDSVYEAFLNYMPAGSLRQRFRTRQNVKGMEKDVFNAYANVASTMAANLNNLEYAQPVENTMRELRAVANEPENKSDAVSSVMKTVEAQVEYMRNPKISQIANALGKGSYMWYLAGNAASAFVNATHLPMVVYPMLLKKGNMGEVGAAMANAMKNFRNGKPTEQYAELFKAAEDAGAMGVHMGQELFDARTTTAAEFAKRNGITIGDKYYDTKAIVDIGMNGMFRTADRFNREVALMAAYDMEMKRNGGNREAAHEAAIKLVNDAYGSSLAEVGPRFLQNNFARVAMTFKRFALNRLFILGKTFNDIFRDASPEARSAARRQLLGIYGMAFLFSGVSGMPGVGALSMLANLCMGNKDDPYDADEEAKQAMGDLLWKGPLGHMLNLEISSRTGWNDMLWKDDPKRMAEVGVFAYIGERAMGPAYSALTQTGQAWTHFTNGQYNRMFEDLTPTSIRNNLKAFRYATEGATNRNGDKIVDNVNAWNVMMQGAGFAPEDLAEARAKAGAMKQEEKKLMLRRTALLDQAYAAQTNGSPEGMSDVMDSISQFNEKNPEIAITGATINTSFRNRQKKSNTAVDGVYLNPKLRTKLMEKYGVSDED
jgi:hypothetical protein